MRVAAPARIVALLVAGGSIALTTSSCGSSSASTRTTSSGELESLIQVQLPEKVRQNGGGAVYVSSVQYARSSGDSYDCVATVKGSDGAGHLATQDVNVQGTCDEKSCVWHTTG